MIQILGTIRGVNVKSKVDDHERTVHNITISLEITEGIDRVQEVIEYVKKIVQISIDSKQPKLVDSPQHKD